MSSRVLDFKTPIEVLSPPLSSSQFVAPPQVFGCVCFFNLHGPTRGKLDPLAFKCVFLGYSPSHKDLPPLRRVASFLLPLREMDSPNPGIGLSVLIIMGRLWFERRKMIIGMDCPWIGCRMGLLGRRPWQFGMPWKKISSGIRWLRAKSLKEKGATESA